MPTTDGYNPLRWDCEKRGCFNQKKRPKIEELASALPGRIGVSDVDGITEINGHALMLEWKPIGVDSIPTGQRIMYENLTRSSPITVFVVQGDAESMEVSKLMRYDNGEPSPWYDCTLDDLRGAYSRWADNVSEREQAPE